MTRTGSRAPAGQNDFNTAPPMLVAQREMRSHERLIWAERPIGRRRWGEVVPRVIFGAFFSGFAVVWMALAAGLPQGDFRWPPDNLVTLLFPAFGLPFVVVGLGLMMSPFRNLNAQPVYAFTDRRVLIMGGRKGRKVTSIDLAGIDDVERTEHDDGSGSLILHGTSGVLNGVANVARVAEELALLRRRAMDHHRYEGRPPH